MKARRVGAAAGVALASALISFPLASTAGADDGNPIDQAADNFLQGIANFFAPEAAGNMFTADQFSDIFTGEGTQADQMVDALYQDISTAVQPEGPIDDFVEGLFGFQF